MEPLERNILARLEKARERHLETNINLHTVWKECGSVDPREFARAWGSLEVGELVHGELHTTDEIVDGLGKITTKGEEQLKKFN